MTAPTWTQLREARWMVVDQDSLLLSVYPTEGGAVAVAFGSHEHDKVDGFRIDPADIPLFQRQLQCACEFVQRQRLISLEFASAQLTFDMLKRLKGGA